MKVKFYIGQKVQLREIVITEPWNHNKGSIGEVTGWDGPLVKVFMHKHRVTVCMNPNKFEPVKQSLRNVA